jgi:ubiquinone/menaquinone biosynthesis C-methylase UbiE
MTGGRPVPVERPGSSGLKEFAEKVLKLRRASRINTLEVERVVALCRHRCAVKRMLDVGTGSGLFAEAFAAVGVTVCGLDPDADMLNAARHFAPGFAWLAAAAEALPFAARTFDLVFMGMVLHETTDPLQALTEARRTTLRRVAVLEWPFPEPGDTAPARRFKTEELRTMARRAGWADVSVTPLSHMVLYLMDA